MKTMRRSPHLRARALRLLAFALRVVVAVVALHMTGLSSVASEIGFRFADAADDCCTDCPLEQSGKECPPDCPVCHCDHGTVALPSAFEGNAESQVILERSAPATPYEASISSAPLLPSVYRPPRVISSSA